MINNDNHDEIIAKRKAILTKKTSLITDKFIERCNNHKDYRSSSEIFKTKNGEIQGKVNHFSPGYAMSTAINLDKNVQNVNIEK